MEAAAQEEVNTPSKDHTVVVKGKRTKRQRLQSPIPFAVAATMNSYGGENNNNHHNSGNSNNSNNISNNSSSPTSSAKLQDISKEEEEDMANCLILLAHGQSHAGSSASLKVQPPTADMKDGGGSNFKYSSRKFLEETNTSGAGKAGYYVYECKTCNRTFPSFQALGGHRASHKKPKAMAEIEKKTQLFALQSDDEDQSQLIKRNNSISSTSLSLQLSSRSLYGIGHNNNNHHNNNNNKSSNKVHECSICGAEFTSGQALGGHMRRHRVPVGTTSPATASVATTALSLSTVSATPLMALEANEDDDQQQRHNKKARNILSLDLDLNLPAPEDDQRVSEFVFVTSKQQQQQQQQQPQQQPPLVFSAPALVDCHY